MICFADDVPPPPVAPTVSSTEAAVADVAAALACYLDERLRMPVARENPGIVRIAGALLGVRPLRESTTAIALSMMLPRWRPPYEPSASALYGFAEVVNRAQRRVYAYAENCWGAGRVVALEWGQRADKVAAGSEEWEQAIADLRVVVAEAAHAECRYAIFDAGMDKAVEAAETAVEQGHWDLVPVVIEAVEAAGIRHSQPSTVSVVECE